jgi:WD40 repeat protein
MRTFSIIEMCFLAFLMGCSDEKPVGPSTPGPVTSHQFILTDSMIALHATYITSPNRPDVIVEARLVIKSRADSTIFTHYSIGCNNFSKSDSLRVKTIAFDEVDTIQIVDTLSSLSPLTEDLTINFWFVGRTYVVQRESSFAWNLSLQGKVAWDNLNEPGLMSVLFDGEIQDIPIIVWMKHGTGFYFNGWIGPVSAIYRYVFGTTTNVRLLVPLSDPKLLDISADDKTLLITASTGSDVYEYEIATSDLRLIIPCHDSIIVGAASYSSDGSKIVLSTISLDTQEWTERLYLWTRVDSALQLIPNIGGVNIRRAVSWLPNSNDRFAVESGSVFITFVTLSTNTKSYALNPFPGFDWQLLRNGFGLAGLQMHRWVAPQENHVWLTDILGGEVRQLTFHPNYISSFSVSPDGTMLAFSGARDNRVGMWILPLSGLMRRRLTSGSPIRSISGQALSNPFGSHNPTEIVGP